MSQESSSTSKAHRAEGSVLQFVGFRLGDERHEILPAQDLKGRLCLLSKGCLVERHEAGLAAALA